MLSGPDRAGNKEPVSVERSMVITMREGRRYSIGSSRIRQGLMEGLVCGEDGTLFCEGSGLTHWLLLRPVDSTRTGSRWGRLCFTNQLDAGMVCTVHAFAGEEEGLLDKQAPFCAKKKLLKQYGGRSFVNQQDILLYALEGRYLFLLFEITGNAKGSIRNIMVDLDGDHFMKTFPEVYQEHNSFFHRYLSVFSTIYKEFEEKIDKVADLIDADKASLPLLPVLCDWLGIDVSGNFLREDQLRTIVREGYQLNLGKGTRQSLERMAEIALGERAVIVERSILESYIPIHQQTIYARLYGSDFQDITILVRSNILRHQRAQLLFLLEQFKPVRSRLRLACLTDSSFMDSYCYLDVNARLFQGRFAALDEDCDMNGTLF